MSADDQELEEERDYILNLLAQSIPAGHDSVEDLREAVFDVVERLPEEDPEWLERTLEESIAAKLADQETWPERLDTDRLDHVFEELEDWHILALHDAGMTSGDAMVAVDQTWWADGGPDSHWRGFCYYHMQDVHHAVTHGSLMLGFGALGVGESDPAKSVKVGNQIEHRFREAGFGVTWDGTADRCISIEPIDFRRRGFGFRHR